MSDVSAEITNWVAGVTGGQVKEIKLVSTGGRQGYRVDVEKEGKPLGLFMQQGRPPGTGQFSTVTREAEIFRALEAIGVTVPHVWGASEDYHVILLDRLEGGAWFQEPPDPQQRVTLAQAYISELAKWHSTPAADLALPSFKPIKTARAHQEDQLAGIRKVFQEEDAKKPLDALARVTLDYLEKQLPDYDGQAVLCQGDTGPGNFLYVGNKITGVIDWELAHIGDPMDDIAWLTWRATQHGFPDMPERLREYEKLSGIEVVPQRVYYYRVNACARLGPWFGLASMAPAPRSTEFAADNDRAVHGGQWVTGMLHRRMRLEALGQALGMDLPPRITEAPGAQGEHSNMYHGVLAQLQNAVGRIEDRLASGLIKGAARQVKYLKQVDLHGESFSRAELADISKLLGRTVSSFDEGRPALADAAREGKVSFEGYFLYHWNRMTRDDFLMREASGKMFERSWPKVK
ncbi:MAG: phosphotransferase family protein [Caulobacterales bacterium]